MARFFTTVFRTKAGQNEQDLKAANHPVDPGNPHARSANGEGIRPARLVDFARGEQYSGAAWSLVLRNSPEIDSRIDIGADSMDGSAAKLMGRGEDKEMGRTIAMPVFSLSPPLLISPSISSRIGGL